MTDPTFARTITIAQAARLMGRPYRTVFRQLLALHHQDRERGEAMPWLERQPATAGAHKGRGMAWRLNLSALRALHPELFEQRYVTRNEHDELEERVSSVERKLERLKVA